MEDNLRQDNHEQEPTTGTPITVNFNNENTKSNKNDLPAEAPQAFIPPILDSEKIAQIPEVESYNPNPTLDEAVVPTDLTPEPVAPTTTPIESPSTQPNVAKPIVHSSGALVLQWLTYAFWLLTIIAMSTLTVIVLSFFISKADTGNSAAYAIAAIIVLLPVTIVCDLFYAKHEPEVKTGASSVIAIIHSVLFALLGIGALITAVFSLVTVLTDSSDLSGTWITLYSALIIALLFAAAFLRTILPKKFKWIRRDLFILLVIAVGVTVALGITGPTMGARLTRNDKLIENNLSDIQNDINNYVSANNELPTTLNNLTLVGDSQKLVTDGLVTYTKIGQPIVYSIRNETVFRYQLCATYTVASTTDSSHNFKPITTTNSTTNSDSTESEGYLTYLSNATHPAGKVCYKLATTVYNQD